MDRNTFRYEITSGDGLYYSIPWMSPMGTKFSIILYLKGQNGRFEVYTESVFHHLKLQKDYGAPVKELIRNVAYIEGMTLLLFRRTVNTAALKLFNVNALMGETMGCCDITSGRFHNWDVQ